MAKVPVRYEAHEGGGLIWVRMGPPIAKWVCVWSSAHGNVGQYLPTIPSSALAAGVQIPAAWMNGEQS